jgi:hypothetical protein
MLRFDVAVPGLRGALSSPRHCLADQWRSNGAAGENRVNLVRHGFEHALEKLPCRLFVSRCNALSDGEPGCPVKAHDEEELAPGGLHLGDVDVDRANVFATGSRTAGEGRWDSA